VALGECGQDRTIPPAEWHQQEEVFLRMLRLANLSQLLVLHLRGKPGDVYGADVHGFCLMLMELHGNQDQRIHIHCFMGKADTVDCWLRRYPNVYFGVTAAVRSFDEIQFAGLRAIPHDGLLLETDAPYFPMGPSTVSTPVYLGETAAFVAAHLGIGTSELLRPVRIRVRIGPPHPHACRKRRLNGAVLRMRPGKPRSRVTVGVAR
jgi:Tat protein secretion system quality control protein TatD with DNase activity